MISYIKLKNKRFIDELTTSIIYTMCDTYITLTNSDIPDFLKESKFYRECGLFDKPTNERDELPVRYAQVTVHFPLSP